MKMNLGLKGMIKMFVDGVGGVCMIVLLIYCGFVCYGGV